MSREKIEMHKWLLLLLIIFHVPILHAQSATQASAKKYVGIGYSSDLMTGADVRDIKIALKIWSQELIKGLSLDYQVETFIFNDLQSYETAIRDNKVNLASIPALDYLRIRKKLHLRPAIVGGKNGKVENQYVILVSKQAAIKQLGDLKGKRLLTLASNEGKISQMWLEVLLRKSKLGTTKSLVRNIKQVNQESQAILPVFFRQADCCIVPQNAFHAMAELNPQIGQELVALATSPRYLPSVFCYSASLDGESRKALTNLSKTLGGNAAGKQVLTLFRRDKLVSYKPSFLTNIETLFQDYQKLNGAKE